MTFGIGGRAFREGAHGSAARYKQGCRCDHCRGANASVVRRRDDRAREAAAELPVDPERKTCSGVAGAPCPSERKLYKNSVGGLCSRCRLKLAWNGLVPADSVRAHLKKLSSVGVGLRSVADASDVPRSLLYKIAAGERTQVRARTEQKILAVDAGAVADSGVVDAAETWRRIARLERDHGFTREAIAQRIGQTSGRLQVGRKRVLARTAHKIKKLLADADGDFLSS